MHGRVRALLGQLRTAPTGPGDIDDIRKVIDQLHSVSPLKVVIFADGEPTCWAITSWIRSPMRIARIITRVYECVLAAARRRGEGQVAGEAGLAEINISADDYHLPFIPVRERRARVARVASDRFLSVIIANCRGPGSRVTPTSSRAAWRGHPGDLRRYGWRQRLGGPAGTDGLRHLQPRTSDVSLSVLCIVVSLFLGLRWFGFFFCFLLFFWLLFLFFFYIYISFLLVFFFFFFF